VSASPVDKSSLLAYRRLVWKTRVGEEGFPVRVSGQAFGVSSPPEPLAQVRTTSPLQTLTTYTYVQYLHTLEGSPAVPCAAPTAGGHRTLLCVRSRKDPAVILTQVGFTPPRAAGDDASGSYISLMRMRGAICKCPHAASCIAHKSELLSPCAKGPKGQRGPAAEKASAKHRPPPRERGQEI
jgi:hypothetical protein